MLGFGPLRHQVKTNGNTRTATALVEVKRRLWHGGDEDGNGEHGGLKAGMDSGVSRTVRAYVCNNFITLHGAWPEP